MSKKKIVLIVVGIIVMLFLQSALITGLLYWAYSSAKVEVYDNIEDYNKYIGEDALDYFETKWEMDESIFPKTITSDMNVLDYKMVYYNPWDAQYLSYLVVEYNDEDYKNELARLEEYNSTEYIGYYSVTGFTKYKLLAMYADSYNGFVYAISNRENEIIYVELIFCNYFYDLDYKEYINEDYLPDGFDATLNNPYEKENTKKN